MTTYSFKTQLAKGEEQERRLDAFFKLRGWKIEPTTMTDQRRGIDRWFSVSMQPGSHAIEYKTDFKSHETGNAYLETVSVGKYDTNNEFHVHKEGWLWTTQADFLMYYIPGSSRILLFIPSDLRDFVVENEGKYRSVSVKNSGYQGRGLLVPISHLEGIAKRDWQIGIDNKLTS